MYHVCSVPRRCSVVEHAPSTRCFCGRMAPSRSQTTRTLSFTTHSPLLYAETPLRLTPRSEVEFELLTLIHKYLQLLALASDAPPLVHAAALLRKAAFQATPHHQHRLVYLLRTHCSLELGIDSRSASNFVLMDDLLDLRNGSTTSIPPL